MKEEEDKSVSGPVTTTGAHLVNDGLERAAPQLCPEVLGKLPDERGLEGVAARAQRAAHQPRALPHHRAQVQVFYSRPCRTHTGLLEPLGVSDALVSTVHSEHATYSMPCNTKSPVSAQRCS